MPVEQKVVAMFMAICPALPIPEVTSFPFAVHLFYDEFYSSFISVRHWNVQYGLCLFLQKLLNGCNHIPIMC